MSDKPKFPTVKKTEYHGEQVVTNKMVDYYFDGTNFGPNNTTAHRMELLAHGVLKNQAGYWNGHTLFQIMVACELVSKKANITRRGKLFIYNHFCRNNV